MDRTSSSAETVRFGVFELDLRAGELRKQGTRIKLQEQPLLILQALLERPGEVVTREELQAKVWTPGDIRRFRPRLAQRHEEAARRTGRFGR